MLTEALSRFGNSRRIAFGLGFALLAVALAWLATDVSPVIALALMVVPIIVISPIARLLVVVFGGIIVFQASQELTVEKLGYLASVCLCIGVASIRLRRLTESNAYRLLRPVIW